jgi:isopentenyl diphosphate isomerase/L-lactate dehydrogenase-like FMN-dependent dehydrogenase
MMEEFKEEAFRRLKDKLDFGIIEGGTETGATVKANKEALGDLFFIPRLIHDVEPSLEIEFFGEKLKTPAMIAPLSGIIEAVCGEAYLELANASDKVGCVLWVGYPIKEDIKKIVESTSSPVVQIVKPLGDRSKLLHELLAAEAAGCKAVGIDIDSSAGVKIGSRSLPYGSLAPLSEAELKKLKQELGIPLILKGILSGRDARVAGRTGVEGIVVSNHGGRVLDTCIPSIVALPAVEKFFPGHVFVDGGFRSGGDVLKGLALGADGVLIGRPVIYGLAKKADGVVRLFETLNSELNRCMLLTGVGSVRRVPRAIVKRYR